MSPNLAIRPASPATDISFAAINVSTVLQQYDQGIAESQRIR